MFKINHSFVSYAGNDHNAALAAIKAKFPSAFFNGPVMPFNDRQLITVTDENATNAALRKVVKGKFRGHCFPSR